MTGLLSQDNKSPVLQSAPPRPARQAAFDDLGKPFDYKSLPQELKSKIIAEVIGSREVYIEEPTANATLTQAATPRPTNRILRIPYDCHALLTTSRGVRHEAQRALFANGIFHWPVGPAQFIQACLDSLAPPLRALIPVMDLELGMEDLPRAKVLGLPTPVVRCWGTPGRLPFNHNIRCTCGWSRTITSLLVASWTEKVDLLMAWGTIVEVVADKQHPPFDRLPGASRSIASEEDAPIEPRVPEFLDRAGQFVALEILSRFGEQYQSIEELWDALADMELWQPETRLLCRMTFTARR